MKRLRHLPSLGGRRGGGDTTEVVKILLKPLKVVRGMPDSEYVAQFPPADLTLVLYPIAVSSFILTPPGLHSLPLSLTVYSSPFTLSGGYILLTEVFPFFSHYAQERVGIGSM